MIERKGDDHKSKARNVKVLLIGTVLVALACTIFACFAFSKSSDQLIEEANVALESSKYDQALQLAKKALSSSPESQEALLIAARAAGGQGDVETALVFYDQLPNDGSESALEARRRAGKLAIESGRLTPAIRQFYRLFEQDPNSVLAHERLVNLLGSCSRAREAIPHRLALIRAGPVHSFHLYMLSLDGSRAEDPAKLHQFYAANPNDPSCLLGEARLEIDNQNYDRAKQMLRRAIEVEPGLLAAQIKLGQLLLDKWPAEFLSWHSTLPDEANADPTLWALRGRWASRAGEQRVAIRCFWEALRRDPNQQLACYQLGQLLLLEKKSGVAEAFLQRSQMMEEYRHMVDAAKTGDLAKVQRAAELAETLGLLWEAYAWAQMISIYDPTVEWARHTFNRVQPKLAALPLRRTAEDANPALKLDLANYPLPDWHSNSTRTNESIVVASAKVTFAEVSREAGISFQYVNGGQPEKGTTRIFETTGGGVAILDYDKDGWPDIYLTQGCSWPPKENEYKFVDKLFRNRGDGTFDDVTNDAGIAENRYSQGVTVGDFNNDGFPDLYVANIGRNRLYQNNSDGTFSDVTDNSNVAGDRWTTSCVMADFNGDTWPDIYAVNYLEGNLARICGGQDGKTGICHPSNYPASQDNLYLNLGDGRFDDVTSQCGVLANDGKGLGVVAADFDGSGRLDLFVANDAVANFFFTNRTTQNTKPPKFRQDALLLGVALGENGMAAGCMGVAAGDSNRDGLLDLFVTNFAGESNALYIQKSIPQFGSLFEDAIAESGMQALSYSMVGFGTQFIDADLDGNLDIIATNGHVGKYEGKQYQMRPQYFHNVGRGNRFVELKNEVLGSYFQAKYLGRGLARLDWNRDGKEDVVISHLDAPAALLTNTTETVGHHLAISLVGIQSDRDAIGTILVGKTKGQTWTHQLTAGDGYQASNQRQIVFGLGDETQLDQLTVRWPAGKQQTFADVSADAEYILIENRKTLTRAQ